jgi:hypothetical protein
LTGNQTLIARTALSVVAGAISIAAVSSARLRALPRQTLGYLWLLIESLRQITASPHHAAEDRPAIHPILVHST